MSIVLNYLVRDKFDRRLIDDRRRLKMHEPSVVVEKRRKQTERRGLAERRASWARITQYSSIYLAGKTL